MELVIIGILILLGGIFIFMLPKHILNEITNIFSFGTKGIRYIKRRRDKVDTLGNGFLFLSILFSIFYFVIPYYRIVYGILLSFVFLCVLAWANSVTKKETENKRKIILLGYYLIYATSFVCACGMVNGMVSEKMISIFYKDLMDQKVFDIFYILTNPCVVAYILQGLLFLFPMYVLWAQFKYMRLEKSYKAANLFTFVIKVIVICVVLFLFSYQGFDFINYVYQVGAKEI